MITIGLTGSIGMGKTTTAELFKKHGVGVLDSDQLVHELYRNEAVAAVENLFPGTTDKNGVNRQILAEILRVNPDKFSLIEGIIHPLVKEKQDDFLNQLRKCNAEFALLDIPLLFETNAQDRFDYVVTVSAPEEIQKQRVLPRPNMTDDKLRMILSRQLPDSEKRQRADFVIDTSRTIENVEAQVINILDKLRMNKNKV